MSRPALEKQRDAGREHPRWSNRGGGGATPGTCPLQPPLALCSCSSRFPAPIKTDQPPSPHMHRSGTGTRAGETRERRCTAGSLTALVTRKQPAQLSDHGDLARSNRYSRQGGGKGYERWRSHTHLLASSLANLKQGARVRRTSGKRAEGVLSQVIFYSKQPRSRSARCV